MQGQRHLVTNGARRTAERLMRGFEDPEILLTAAKGIDEATRRMGADPDRLLHKYRPLCGHRSGATDAMPLRDYTQLLEEAADMTANPHFGLEFGENFLMTDLGPIGYLLVHASSVREGIELFADHFEDLQQRSSMTLEVSGDLARIVYRINDEKVCHRRQDAEFTLAMLHGAFRRLFGERWRAMRVEFVHLPLRSGGHHAHFFDSAVEFCSRESALVFDRDLLDLPMPTPDPLLVEHLKDYFVRLRVSRRSSRRPDLAQLVTRQVEGELRAGHTSRLAEVAATIGISERALNRELAAEGTSFRRILLVSRLEAATVLLRDTAMPLTEIAFEVGYSDATSFSRAFRQKNKLPPLVWRKRLTTPAEQ